MDLFLVRHAIAEPRRPGLPDAARGLTPRGVRRFRKVVDRLAAMGLRFERIYHSPWRRAVETAELLAPLCSGPLQSTPALAEPPSAVLFEDLGGEQIALVGHEPFLGALATLLVFGDEALGARIVVKKGGVVWLRGEPARGGMCLRALLPPRALCSGGSGSKA
ncbi:MAG: phosphohistidine phosphatase [Deltaproteobacteria bacterium]|nr:MAG: phosphohistidine phosphatase [Deltaproteobacteria bacterium]